MGKTDVIAGLAAGLTGAVTIFLYLTISLPLFLHIAPVNLYEWDASNIVGLYTATHEPVAATVLIGQSAHIVVSIIWGVVFVALLRVVASVARLPVAWGIMYGVFVMLFMHYLVVPLGHAPQIPYTVAGFTNTLVAHTLFFGVPVALVATRLTGAVARSSP